ncbi:MAG: NADH-quinone oxidoreductase subunit L [Bacteroidetes bacterium]|nr:NADH-quinone oxidoreductase subunit L [Bacteroidota bacterium]
MLQYIYLVPLFPLIGFLINGLGWKSLPHKAGGIIASLAILASFVVSFLVFLEVKAGAQSVVSLFPFIQTGSLNIQFAFQVDALSSLFLLIITGVGFLIHIYSAGYMAHDEGVVKYFAYLNLFVFSMLLLVLGASYPIMYMGWEGVGLCSYLLIGFWYKNRDFASAGKKAFVMNRIGDLGFLVGMLLILFNYGTLSYQQFFPQLGTAADLGSTDLKNWIGICFLIGATGKSAQLPLFTWLPDAMAGPTPVSALIHAATMVTAGVYMIARSHLLYDLAPVAAELVAYIGLATALVTATIACRQYDIKKVLAYSTVSQLGFMFIALGCGSYTTAVFHVMTHAFFKALLFLGSGSVIHAMSGEQDIRKMGGLGSKMRITQITFLIACLAIAGIPGFSGFFSKDEILTAAFAHNPVLYYGALLAALMTAFYMFRLYTLTFTGTFRGTEEQAHHVHESPSSMTIPLMVLAVLSIVGGYIGLPAVLSEHNTIRDFLGLNGAVLNSKEIMEHVEALGHSKEWVLIAVSVVVALVGTIAGIALHRRPDFRTNKGLALILERKWYFDELYDAVVVKPLNAFGNILDRYADRKGIDGTVNGVGRFVRWGADRIRLVQSGQVGYYLFIMVLGITALMAVGFFIHS